MSYRILSSYPLRFQCKTQVGYNGLIILTRHYVLKLKVFEELLRAKQNSATANRFEFQSSALVVTTRVNY